MGCDKIASQKLTVGGNLVDRPQVNAVTHMGEWTAIACSDLAAQILIQVWVATMTFTAHWYGRPMLVGPAHTPHQSPQFFSK